MKYNPQIHHRQSIRLQGYDYSRAGLYFITICCKDRECLLGTVEAGKMRLNDYGHIAHAYFKNMPHHYPHTQMHEFVVMPNHVHAIIEIMESVSESSVRATTESSVRAIAESSVRAIAESSVRAMDESPLHESPQQSPPSLRDQRRKMLLSKMVGWYKMNTAKQINIMRQMAGVPLWQRNYHDHIIRNEQSYQTISEYIMYNPARWKDDKFNK